jgi:UDP-GlcNAc:undecaprenyl-phosphate GlcNAc-1-phosphate transferase
MSVSLLLHLAGSALVGLFVTALISQGVRKYAPALNLLDEPVDQRKTHEQPMPTGGGLAIAAGVVAGGAVLYGLRGTLPAITTHASFWAGALVILTTGLWDDRRGVEPKTKFALQLVAAYLLLHAGTFIDVGRFSFVGGSEFNRALYSIPVSLIWVVGIINAVNLIDGMDGLASGVAGIVFLACAALFGVKGHLELMGVGVVVVGALAGFLFYNFKPASLFMGDSGSLFLGYLVAAYSLQGPLHSEPLLAFLMLPVLLGIPVLDTGAAIVRRWRSPQSLFGPDRGHIHHQLVKHGSETRAVLILYAAASWFGSTAFLMGTLPATWAYGLLGVTLALAVAWVWKLGCLAPEVRRPVAPADREEATDEPFVTNGGASAEDDVRVLDEQRLDEETTVPTRRSP